MGGRRKVARPRRWLSWGKCVGRSPRQIRGAVNPEARRRAVQVKRVILCCREKPLASDQGARTPNRHRWIRREYEGDRENPG